MIWLLLATALADVHEVRSAPGSVVVYADRARVTRTISLTLPAGEQYVVFSGLPALTQAATLTADARGPGVMRGVDARRVSAREVADARVKEIEEKLLALRDRRQDVDDRVNAAQAQLRTVERSQAQAAKALSAQLLVGTDAAGRSRAMRASLAGVEDEVRRQIRGALLERRDLDTEIGSLDRERATLGSSATDTWTASVRIDMERGGPVQVDLSYLVGDAGWVPRYDIRGEADGGKVELSLSALVTQRTGEDWSGVALTVSSARPSQGTDVPTLDPFWLQPPRVYSRSASTGSAKPAASAAPRMEMMDEAAAPAPPPAPEPMEVARATVSTELSATSFAVSRREDLPSDGSAHKVLLTTEQLDSELRHISVPRLDPRAYLVGEVTNTAAFPLLSGRAGVFLSGAYLGEFVLVTVPPGEKFDIAFGVDDRVSVKRAPVKIEIGDTGLAGKRARAQWTWELRVKNAHKSPVRVEVREQLPLSSREDVAVKRLADAAGAPVPVAEDGGVLRFEIPLAAGQTKSFTWGYLVEYPSDLSLGWME